MYWHAHILSDSMQICNRSMLLFFRLSGKRAKACTQDRRLIYTGHNLDDVFFLFSWCLVIEMIFLTHSHNFGFFLWHKKYRLFLGLKNANSLYFLTLRECSSKFTIHHIHTHTHSYIQTYHKRIRTANS